MTNGTFRSDFRSCSVFTDGRSIDSIINACNFSRIDRRIVLSILDAFSGDGIVADALSSYLRNFGVRHVTTAAEIDISHLERISSNHQKIHIDLSKDSLPERYDLIVSRYGLHDLSLEDKEKTISNLAIYLKPNGRLIITDIMPDKEVGPWLEEHHQQKEDITNGRNSQVCLSPVDTYIGLLTKNGINAEVFDCFYQEVFVNEWVKTYGASDRVIKEIEDKVLSAPENVRNRLLIFNHPARGVRIYYPICTIRGTKN